MNIPQKPIFFHPRVFLAECTSVAGIILIYIIIASSDLDETLKILLVAVIGGGVLLQFFYHQMD